MTDDWTTKFDQMPVTGNCDAHCGKPATTWFGHTSCATCGDSACINALRDSYEQASPNPHLQRAKIAGLEAGVDALQRQKAALQVEVDVLRRCNGWQAAKLIKQAQQLNQLSPIPEAADLDQRIEDWHESRAGIDQQLHEYLGLTWAEYVDWISPLPRPAPTPLTLVLEKVDDLCERFELEGLHSHPTYKQFKRLWAELDALKNSTATKFDDPSSEP